VLRALHCVFSINKQKDGSESDVDCGGTCLTKCPKAKKCKVAGDCASSVCLPLTKASVLAAGRC
jgi:hypothetical protein